MNNNQTQKDLHLIYSISVEDIKFAKLQQWRITYYTFMLVGGIFYLRRYHHIYIDFIFHLAALVVPLAAIWFLVMIERNILEYRFKLVKVRGCLSDEFMCINPIDKNYLKTISPFKIKIPLYNYQYLLIQIITIYFAGILLCIIPPILKS